MTRRSTWQRPHFGLVLGAVLILTPILNVTSARAADPIARFAVTAAAGGGLIKMDDVNARISAGNAFLTAPPRNWAELNRIRHGYNFAWDVRSRIVGPFSASIGGGMMFGQTRVDFDQVITVRPSMNFYHVRGIYQLPFRPMNNMILSIGGGPIYIPESRLKVEHEKKSADAGTERIETATLLGKGWGGHAFIQSEFVLTDKITFLTDLGYRMADVPHDSFEWKITGRNLVLTDNNNNDILDGYEFDNDTSFLPHSFVAVDELAPGVPRATSDGKPVLKPIKDIHQDFSGVLLNIGLRFYLF